MRLLITGGAGFIGANFVRYMLEKHDDYEGIKVIKEMGYLRLTVSPDKVVVDFIQSNKGDIVYSYTIK